MNKLGRPPSTEAKTAYDYRRYILLVQCLAAYPTEEAVAALCQAWGIEPLETRLQTLQALAQHAIEYHKENK